MKKLLFCVLIGSRFLCASSGFEEGLELVKTFPVRSENDREKEERNRQRIAACKAWAKWMAWEAARTAMSSYAGGKMREFAGHVRAKL
jgi:hypothetical protein